MIEPLSETLGDFRYKNTTHERLQKKSHQKTNIGIGHKKTGHKQNL